MRALLNLISRICTPRFALIVAVCIQMAAGAVAIFIHRDRWCNAENRFYDLPAWNAVEGHGFSLRRDTWEDPYLTREYYRLHPELRGDDYIPAAALPPGYSFFLSGLYAVVGHSHLIAVICNVALVIASIFLYDLLLARSGLSSAAHAAGLLFIGTCPAFAWWASYIKADTLNMFLLAVFAVLFLVPNVSPVRLVAAGVVLGLTALVRPYAVLLPFAFLIAHLFFWVRSFQWWKVAVVAAACWIICAGWVVRNHYWFGMPMMTSVQPGFVLWLASHWGVEHPSYEHMDKEVIALGFQGCLDCQYFLIEENRRYGELALEEIKEEPLKYVLLSILRIPRRWIGLSGGLSIGENLALGIPQAVVLVLMVVGLVQAWRSSNPVVAGCFVMVVYYSLIFLPVHAEARYMQPVRGFGFILSALAIDWLWKKIASRRGAVQGTAEESAAVKSE